MSSFHDGCERLVELGLLHKHSQLVSSIRAAGSEQLWEQKIGLVLGTLRQEMQEQTFHALTLVQDVSPDRAEQLGEGFYSFPFTNSLFELLICDAVRRTVAEAVATVASAGTTPVDGVVDHVLEFSPAVRNKLQELRAEYLAKFELVVVPEKDEAAPPVPAHSGFYLLRDLAMIEALLEQGRVRVRTFTRFNHA